MRMGARGLFHGMLKNKLWGEKRYGRKDNSPPG